MCCLLDFFDFRNRCLCIHLLSVDFRLFSRQHYLHEEIIDDSTVSYIYSVFGFVSFLSVGHQPNFFIQQRNDLV